jgi:4-amino-4-deoxy-L-arabinose transferase-like glycosyltransferase
MPWTLLWPLVYLVGRRQVFTGSERGRDAENRRAWRFLLSCVVASLVFFSLSSGKRGIYLLPAFPAAALLCGDALVRHLSGRSRLTRPLTVGAAALALLLAAVALNALLAGQAGLAIALPDDWIGTISSPLLTGFGIATLAALAGGSAAWIALARRRGPLIFFPAVAIAAVLAFELSVFLLLYPALQPIKTPRPPAVAAASITEPGDPIGLVGDRTMTGGLAYYANRRVAELSTPEEIRRFVDDGGSAIVVKTRKADRVEQVTPFEIVSRSRTGRREILVVTPKIEER